MYEQHFGLKKRPFRTHATGTDVFVGPQTAKTMAGFRKALASRDAAVTVSGPVGVGKTTLVARALQSIEAKKKTVRVGRMQMDSSDVLESLLVVLGVPDYPAGTIQRFAALRKKLKELEDAAVRVFIVVEDAVKTGAETLAELEALTAKDAGESGGASIILMGDERLTEFMKNAQLGQLQQRIRQRHVISPLSAAELRGYLRHCFRLAGGDFDQVFDSKSAELLHRLSDGVPRITNNIVESVLAAAAEQGIQPVPAELIAKIAADEFGFHADDFEFTSLEPIPSVAENIARTEPEPEPVAEVQPEPVAEIQPEPEPEPEPPFVEEPQPVIVFADEAEAPPAAAEEIPELIQDTLPNLAILAPHLATSAEAVAEEIPELVAEPVAEEIPELVAEPVAVAKQLLESQPMIEPEPVAEVIRELEQELDFEPVTEVIPVPEAILKPGAVFTPEDIPELVAEEPAAEEIPEWDRDPTLAQLKPDLEALEQAMKFAHGGSFGDAGTQDGESESSAGDVADKQDIPEITLDKSISTGIENHLVEEPADILPPYPAKKEDPEHDRIAANIAKATSIEDFDDKMAETLFGTEISMIGAQLINNPPPGESANDALQLEPEAPAAKAPVPKVAAPTAPVQVAEEVSLETHTPRIHSGMDLSASQRLKTVRALNADLHPSLRQPEAPQSSVANSGSVETPVSIEDQINTSITQTLKALKVPSHLLDDEPEEETKNGFFSRFRRS